MPRTRLLAVGLAVGLIAVACGGDSEDDQATLPEGTPTATEATPDEGPQPAGEPDPSREDAQQEQDTEDEPEQPQDGPRFLWCEEVLDLWDNHEGSITTEADLDVELAFLASRDESYDNDPSKTAPYARAWEALLGQAPDLQAAIDKHAEAEAEVADIESLLPDIQRAADAHEDINSTPVYRGAWPATVLDTGIEATRSILRLAERAGAAPEDVAALWDEVTARQAEHRIALDSVQVPTPEAGPHFVEVTAAALAARSRAGEARDDFQPNMFGIGDAEAAATEALNSNSADTALIAAREAVDHLFAVFDAKEALHEATVLAERASADADLLMGQFEEDLDAARGTLRAASEALSDTRQGVLSNEPAVAAYTGSLQDSCR